MKISDFVVKVANPYFYYSDAQLISCEQLDHAIKYATKNKIFPMFYEGCLKYGIYLSEKYISLINLYKNKNKAQFNAIRLILDISEKYNLELMLIKTFKPFNYAPDDVDLLLRNGEDLNLLIDILKKYGYFILKIGTPEVVLRRVEDGTYVDLDIHKHLAIGHLKIFETEKLWRSHAYDLIEIENGCKLLKLSDDYEVVREAAYSLLKDFNLSVSGLYLAIDAMLKRDIGFIEDIARKENLLPHLYLYLSVARSISYRLFGADAESKLRYDAKNVNLIVKLCKGNSVPYQYPIPVIAWAYMSKALLELGQSRDLKVISQILKQPSSKGINILLNYFKEYLS